MKEYKTPLMVTGFFLLLSIVATFVFVKQKKVVAIGSASSKPSVWIDWWHPKEGSRGGHYYNDLIKLNDHEYLYVGKDGLGNTFDSSIITINK